MESRLPTSKKWTPFPEELAQQIHEVLTDRFAEEYDIEHFQFVVEGRIYGQEILLRTGLNSQKQLKQPNFEISLEFDPQKDKALQRIHDFMDLIGHLWENFLEEEMDDAELPRKWQKMNFGGLDTYFRYSTVNTELEKQADILLETYEKKLVYGQDEMDSKPKISLRSESQELH